MRDAEQLILGRRVLERLLALRTAERAADQQLAPRCIERPAEPEPTLARRPQLVDLTPRGARRLGRSRLAYRVMQPGGQLDRLPRRLDRRVVLAAQRQDDRPRRHRLDRLTDQPRALTDVEG